MLENGLISSENGITGILMPVDVKIIVFLASIMPSDASLKVKISKIARFQQALKHHP